MTTQTRILVFAGSARTHSMNKQLATEAYRLLGEAGADATLLDLRDYPMPIYDGDLEEAEGVPENARKIKEFFKQHDGILIVAPEYNSSITPLLKNTIDWVSRPLPNEAGNVPYKQRVAALMGASAGNLGGLRGLFHVRQILTTLGMVVIPEQLALSRAHEAFDGDGRLLDAQQREAVRNIATRLIEVSRRLKAV